MKHLKLFEEYKFFKFRNDWHNERDIKEPFFNANKPEYFRKKKEKEIEDQKRRDLLPLNTTGIPYLRIGRYANYDNIKEIVTRIFDSGRTKLMLQLSEDGGGREVGDIYRKLLRDLNLEQIGEPAFPDKPWHYVDVKRKDSA